MTVNIDDFPAWTKHEDYFELPMTPFSVSVMHFHYTNHAGEISERRVIPVRVQFTATEWHPSPQWFLLAYDLAKGDQRMFAMKDMENMRHDSQYRL